MSVKRTLWGLVTIFCSSFRFVIVCGRYFCLARHGNHAYEPIGLAPDFSR